jgi:hypothetical protein
VVGFGLAFAFSPGSGSPGQGLRTLLLVGASGHVAATAWFAAVPEVRAHARAHPRRYVVAPVALVAVAVVGTWLLSVHQLAVVLLAFFAWQFVHFQKQNLGLAALTATAFGSARLGTAERRCLTAVGWAGAAGLVAHPALLQLDVDPHLGRLFPLAAAGYLIAVVAGLVVLLRRGDVRSPFGAVFALGLAFFAPVFVFDSPYTAVAGLVLTHGLQYLLLMGCVASRPFGEVTAGVSAAVLVNAVLIGGLLINSASHRHGTDALSRGLFGVYLGLTMAHFVVDAGLWRLRDAFPRELLEPRLPYLLRP